MRSANDTLNEFNIARLAYRGYASEQLKFLAFNECAMSDGDSRTPLLSFSEWVNAGKPCRPARA